MPRTMCQGHFDFRRVPTRWHRLDSLRFKIVVACAPLAGPDSLRQGYAVALGTLDDGSAVHMVAQRVLNKLRW